MVDDTTEARITLRLPAALRDRLTAGAAATERSMNGEIVFRLEQYEQLLGMLAETKKLLEQREEALFHDRVQLQKTNKLMEGMPTVIQQREELEQQKFEHEMQRRELEDELAEVKAIVLELLRALNAPEGDYAKTRAASRAVHFLAGIPREQLAALEAFDFIEEDAQENYSEQVLAGIREFRNESAEYIAKVLRKLGWTVVSPSPDA